MKPMICEMCGCNDLVKKNGVFVCQACGTKYSIEEAKKLKIEGSVDVQGMVKIDTSDRLNNLYILARRAKDENNEEDARKYYNQIAIEVPDSWEAQFYKVYFTCMQTKIANMSNACVKLSQTIDNTFNLIKTNVTDEKEQHEAYEEIYIRCLNYSLMISNNIISHANGYSDASRALAFVNEQVSGVVLLQVKIGDACNGVNLKEEALQAYKASTTYFKNIDISTRNSIVERIKELEPSYNYEPPQSTGGCYIATAVYGSYDCPQVWTLRRYRDFTLAKTRHGRNFIRTYYAISPTIVKLFGNTEWFKRIWRGKLDYIVKKLQGKGYESTPYNDRKW